MVKAVVNALAEKSLVNVISTPSVMVLDNHTASIQVGDPATYSVAPISDRRWQLSQTSIEYKDTGVKLEVTPSVNDGGLVTLEVDFSRSQTLARLTMRQRGSGALTSAASAVKWP